MRTSSRPWIYCGVTILVTGSYIPIIYYSFYCYPTYRKMHLTIIAILNILNLSVMATPSTAHRKPGPFALLPTSWWPVTS